MSKRALLLIDIQNDYFPQGRWEVAGMESAARHAARLLGTFRKSGESVIHIRHENPMPEAPFFVSGSEGARTHDSVLPQEGEPVVLKHRANSFRDTNLKELLDERDITDLVICGAMSHMCIDAATRAGADLGYTITVIHDACASRDLEFGGTVVPAAQAHAAFMSALGFAYAKVLSADEFLSGA